MVETGRSLRRMRNWHRLPVATAAATLLLVGPLDALSATVDITSQRTAGNNIDIVVPVNMSQIIHIDQPFKELFIGNSDIADVMVMSDRSVYVLGKKVGTTSLTILGPNKKVAGVMDLSVSLDLQGLKRKLFEVLPDEPIDVTLANGGALLSGTVSSAARLATAIAVAERYAPQAVTNNLSVQGSQQVMLQVRFVEISRTLARALGLSLNIVNPGGVTFQTIGTLTDSFANILGQVATGGVSVDALLQALETKGLVKTLAEPNLVALSGDTASFLAGGEFPIPVAQQNNTITIEFKQFGVGLAFTPTVVGKDLINLVVTPEVSQPDRTNALNENGFQIPALTTRRATTTIELRDGQSFAMAGLIQSNLTDTVRQIPWLGDVPLLGALFRSAQFQRNETELVILVTPRLVAPAPSGSVLATPLDYFSPPSDAGLFLLGKVENTHAAAAANIGTTPPVPPPDQQGGLSGTYGHIIQ